MTDMWSGQVLASRPDIVREDYMEELCTLQDDVPSFPDALVRRCCLLGVHTTTATGRRGASPVLSPTSLPAEPGMW